MSDWHGYPQHLDAHPERPWWRRLVPDDEESPWRRADGVELCPAVAWVGGDHYDCGWQDGAGWVAKARELWPFRLSAIRSVEEEAIALVDAAHPLPPPEPRCGQVWVLPDLATHCTVIGVQDGAGYYVDPRGAHRMPWPPPGAVLVAGPGAPWAPMGGDL